MARRFVATLALGLILAGSLAFSMLSGSRDGTTPPAPVVSAPARPLASLPAGASDIRSAERNLYPAPETALQLADDLGLDPAQRQDLRMLQQRVDGELTALSRRIASEERRLDFAFAQGNVNPGRIDGITAQIGTLQGRLRATRLRGHLATRSLLNADQLLRYAELRGFQPAPPDTFDDLDRDDIRHDDLNR